MDPIGRAIWRRAVLGEHTSVGIQASAMRLQDCFSAWISIYW